MRPAHIHTFLTSEETGIRHHFLLCNFKFEINLIECILIITEKNPFNIKEEKFFLIIADQISDRVLNFHDIKSRKY